MRGRDKKPKWTTVKFSNLPKWLQDNNYLINGHRPQIPSYFTCAESIFSVHTETGNIWTHLLGCLTFICVTLWFIFQPSIKYNWNDKIAFLIFFIGSIMCLLLSTVFHTFLCHSENINKLFSKLDYCGIACMIMGSFSPWLYYGFYCKTKFIILYGALIIILGSSSIVVSMWNKFSLPKYRPLRAGVFIALGLSGVFPAVHFLINEGLEISFHRSALGWLILMALTYIGGALTYVFRFPERLWTGKFDIWCQSHQIFHICVVVAAYFSYYGCLVLSDYKKSLEDC